MKRAEEDTAAAAAPTRLETSEHNHPWSRRKEADSVTALRPTKITTNGGLEKSSADEIDRENQPRVLTENLDQLNLPQSALLPASAADIGNCTMIAKERERHTRPK